jgi:uncharacterized membrane protein
MSNSAPESHDSVERLTTFSDAVVAIAMTLLALELPVPNGNSNAEVLHQFREHLDDYAAFLISFAVIGAHWFAHHRIFGYVGRLGRRLLQGNMWWLLTIVIMPFATRMLTGDGAFEARFITYAAVQGLAATSLAAIIWETRRSRLLRDDAPAELIGTSLRGLIVVAAGFLLSIPFAFLTQRAYLCWLVIPVAVRALSLLSSRQSRG